MKKYHVFLTINGVLSMLLSSCSGNGDADTDGPKGGSSEPPVHEHVWGSPTYEWAADYSSCTAQRVCLTDSKHIENETATSTYNVISEPRCETDGLGRYLVTFENEAFSNQTHDETIDAIGHNYVFDSIVWSGFVDAQVKYVCSHDPHHVQYHNATVTSQVTTSPSCESSGIRTYTATYDGHSDTKNEVLSPLGHSWGSVTYAWTSDYSTCTATRVCNYDSSHIETETVDSIYVETIPPTFEADGEGTYTATFTNGAFETQVVNIRIDQLVRYNGEFPVLSDDGQTITYGLYPQTNVNDSELISALNDLENEGSGIDIRNGWYLYNGEYYTNIITNPQTSGAVYHNGALIPQNAKNWFKCSPILWRELEDVNGNKLLIAEDLLDVIQYDDSSSEYMTSNIRSWLNGNFYDKAFALGNKYLKPTLTNDNISQETATETDYDNVFLLTYQNYTNQNFDFDPDPSQRDLKRAGLTTDYTRASGAQLSNNSPYFGRYFTRTPSVLEPQSHAFQINDEGQMYGYTVDDNFSGVRPAITINFNINN